MDVVDKLLREARPFGARNVSLTGGEPGLHPQFDELVGMIVEAGYTFNFVSNGQLGKPYEEILLSMAKPLRESH